MTAEEKLKKIISDPVLWIETFCKIVNKQGKLVPFKLNPQQKDLVQNMGKYSCVLKSRQLGITSVSCAMSCWYALNNANVHCILVSYSMESVSVIFDKLKQIYDSLPSQIKLKEVANNRSMLKFSNNSKVTVCTLGSKEISRGSSLAYAHISEIAFAKQDMVSKQILAIEQALLPNAKIVLESTANGLNEFYNIYQKAENKESLYDGYFYNWIDDEIMFADEYKAFTKRYKALRGAELTVDELEPIEQTYYGMGATLQQLMWRRLKIANSSEEQFKQEYPASPIESFITTGNNLFNAEKLQLEFNQRKSIKRLTDIPTLPTVLKPYIRSYLTVWEEPKRDMDYFCGIDASEGIGQDYSVIDIYDSDASQVAQFRSNKVQPYEIANIANELCRYYNKALIVCEKASGGHIILDRLRNTYSYVGLYKSKMYDEKGRKFKKIGFINSSKSKPILINNFVEMWENNDMFIRSTATLNEMKTYVFSNGSMNAERSKNDDCVIASALAIHGILHGVKYKW